MRRHFAGPRIAGLLGAALALAAVFTEPALINIARDRVFDQYQRLAPRAYNADPVRVIEIDDAALEKYGQWPWPRHRFAALVDKLEEAGAAAIVFDVILAEPDRTSPGNVAASWLDAPALAPVVAELGAADLAAVDHDRRFAASLAAAPTVLHLTARGGASDGPCPPAREASRVQGMPASDLVRVAPSFRQVVPSLEMFRQAASGEGFARAGLADDAIVRSVPLIALACDGTQVYPGLALDAIRVAAPRLDARYATQAFADAAAKGPCRAHVTGVAHRSVSEVVLCRLRFPTTEDGRLWVHYARPDSMAQRRLSIVDVLDGDAAALGGAVKGRIVIVGAAAEGLRDVLITPLGDERPGVHVHAEVIEQALAGKVLFRAWDVMRPVEVGLAALASLLMLLFLPRLSAAAGFGIWFALTAALFAGAFFAFRNMLMLIDPVTPGLVLAAAFVPAFVVMFQQEQTARRFIRGAFGKFLSPLLIERLERDPSLLKLEGEQREITAFFSDIRGFTSMAEQMTPKALTTMLNQYFTAMTRIVLDRKGLVDKYIGDGLAAMWNAPIDVRNHPEEAARAALEMLASLEKLNASWRASEILPVPEVRIGIGLHTAEARVGNFGSDEKLEYSMLGDMVNLTARLEGLTKEYGAPVIISSETQKRIPDFAAVSLGVFCVAGRKDPTAIFAIVGEETVAASPAFKAFREGFEKGVASLEAGDAPAALEHFSAARRGETFGLDEAIDVFIARAQAAAGPADV